MNKIIPICLTLTIATFNINSSVADNNKFYFSANYGVGIADKFKYDDEDLIKKRPSNTNVYGLALGYKINKTSELN